MKALSFWFALLISTVNSNAQINPNIKWENALGGPFDDRAYSVQQTSDSGFIIAGVAGANGGDVSGNHKAGYHGLGNDYWIVKLNNRGQLQWAKCYGGHRSDGAQSIKQTPDKGFIIAGYSDSNDGDVTGHHQENDGPDDIWVMKIDSIGNLQWGKCYGGSNQDLPYDIELTADGGYIIAGYTQSTNGDITYYHGGFQDCWIIKLSNQGNMEWQKTYGGSNWDFATSIKQLNDKGYVFTGASYSDDGDITNHHGSTNEPDTWVVRIDSVGNIVWQNSYGGSEYDRGNALCLTPNNEIMIAGQTNSTDGDVTGNHGGYDYWIIKLDENGKLLKEVSLGGASDDIAQSVIASDDGGFIIAGQSNSNNGDVTGNHGSADYWIVKLSSNLELKGAISLGGSWNDIPHEIIETSQKDYVITGQSGSVDGDVTGLHNSTGRNYNDYWVVRLEPSAFQMPESNAKQLQEDDALSIYPTLTSSSFTIQANLQGSTAIVQIINANGQTVLNKDEDMINGILQDEISLATLPKGLYFVKVIAGNKEISGKVMKQ